MAAPARSLRCRSLAYLVPIGAVAPPRARAGGTHHAGHGSDPDRLYADAVFFWRESTDDGVYGPGGNLVRAAGNSRARYTGTQIDFSVSYQIDPHWNCSLDYARFFTGSFLRETGPAEDVDFIQFKSAYRF
jgi:hypothetical protein